MSASTLPVSPSTSFPQLLHSAAPAANDDVRSLCSYISPESSWGACDGGMPCEEPTTDGMFCRKHGRKVSRG